MAYSLEVYESRRGGGDWRSTATESRLRAFLEGLDHSVAMRVVEVDVFGDSVRLGIPWPRVEELGALILQLASGLGLVVFDPQRGETVSEEAGSSLQWRDASRRGVEYLGKAASAVVAADDAMTPKQLAAELASNIGGSIAEPPADAGPFGAIDGFLIPPQVPLDEQSSPLRDLLLSTLRSARVTDRRLAAVQAGGWSSDPTLVTELQDLARRDQDRYVRGYAVQSLGLIAAEKAATVIGEAAMDLATLSRGAGRESLEPALAAALGCAALAAQSSSSKARTHLLIVLREVRASLPSAAWPAVDRLMDRLADLRGPNSA